MAIRKFMVVTILITIFLALSGYSLFAGKTEKTGDSNINITPIELLPFQVEGDIPGRFTSPVISGLVYIGTGDYLYGLNIQTGEKRFEKHLGSIIQPTSITSSLTISDRLFYFGTSVGWTRTYPRFDVRKTRSGGRKWFHRTTNYVYYRPAISDDVVYFGDGNYLNAFKSKTDDKIWDFPAKDFINTTPAISAGIVFFGTKGGYLYAVDINTHEEKWSFKYGDSISSPVVSGDLVFFGVSNKDTYSRLYAVNINNGEEKWSFLTGGKINSTPVISDDIVCFGEGFKYFYGLERETGSKKWEFQTGGSIFSSPAVSEGVVYFGCDDRKLYALNINTGKEIWPSFKTTSIVRSTPVISESGTVCFGDYENFFYGIDSKTGQEKWHFPNDQVHIYGRSVPPEIIGRWSYQGSIYEYTPDDQLFVTGAPSTWSVSPDGQLLTFDGIPYDRTAGNGTALLGVWYSDVNLDEFHFRSDGTYTNHWDDGTEYFGQYTTNGNQLIISDFKEVVIVNENHITFDPPYATNDSGQWEINEDELTLTMPDGTYVMTRVP